MPRMLLVEDNNMKILCSYCTVAKLPYRVVVKTFTLGLVVFFVMTVVFVDQLSHESKAAEDRLQAEVKLNTGLFGTLSNPEKQVNISIDGYKVAKEHYVITIEEECSNTTILNFTELHRQTRLIYNMVPKCASLGIREMMLRLGNKLLQGNYNIGTDYIVPFHHTREDVIKIVHQDLNGKLRQKISKYIYQKHLHFIDFSVAGARTPYYINVIRDPVEHHISLYYFQREHRRLKMFSPWHLLINSSQEAVHGRLHRSYDTCVQTNDIECSSAEFLFTIIPFFCGQDIHCITPSARSLAMAKQHVVKYFPLVGYVESLERFFQLAEVVWPQFFKGAVHVYKERKFSRHKTGARTKEPSALTKVIMRERLGLEYDFYNWIKQRFYCLYQRYVETVEEADL